MHAEYKLEVHGGRDIGGGCAGSEVHVCNETKQNLAAFPSPDADSFTSLPDSLSMLNTPGKK